MLASQRVRFQKKRRGDRRRRLAGDSSFAGRRQFILRVGNGRAKINSSFPSWRQEDIRNVKGNSSLSLTKYRRRGVDRSSCAEHNPFVRSFAAESARDHLTDFSRGATTSSSKRAFKKMQKCIYFSSPRLKIRKFLIIFYKSYIH